MNQTQTTTKCRKRDYLAPELEIISVNVEQGFAQSFGDSGKAGGNFGSGGEWTV